MKKSPQQGDTSINALADVLRRSGQIIDSMQRDALLLARVHQGETARCPSSLSAIRQSAVRTSASSRP